MKRSYRCGFLCLNIPFLSIFLILLSSLEAQAESKKSFVNKINNQLILNRAIALTIKPIAAKKKVSPQTVSTSAKNLLAQGNKATKVTGVELKQTNQGLEVVLKTVAGSQRLVPLILPEGKNLVIDILDATLAFAIRNGVTKANLAPGIRQVNLAKIDDSSIRLTITGEDRPPSAEVIPSRQNLILSVTPEKAIAQDKPDEEIEIIATGEGQAEDDYFVQVAGIFSGVFLSMALFTGFIYNFHDFTYPLIYRLTFSPVPPEEFVSTPIPGKSTITLTAALDAIKDEIPEGIFTQIDLPQNKTDVYRVRKKVPGDWYGNPTWGRSYAHVDQYSGKVLSAINITQASLGEKIANGMDILHFGLFGGIFGRILYFCVGLAPTILLITGFTMYRLRRRQPKF